MNLGDEAPPGLFDAELVTKRLVRAACQRPALFLMEQAADDLAARLLPILRQFSIVADLSSPSVHFSAVLAGMPGLVRLVRVAPHMALAGDGPWLTVAGSAGVQPLARASYDLITSAMALHAVNDLPGALVQARQALKPDGLFVACLPGGQTLNELRTCLAQAESEIMGGLSPRVFPFVEIRDLGSLLQRAGFALPVVDSEVLTVRYPSMFELMRDLRAMGATNSLSERQRRPTPTRLFTRAAELYRERFSNTDGRVRATFEILWALGWSPHESQQKPLKPGSAKRRLADALGSV